jgi:2-dehydro-3-deoxy-L-fuconate 4-dehydrogenase
VTPGTRLTNKNCVITAAGSGIGRATALAFAREGANVLATDIDTAALRSVAELEPSIRTAVIDVTDAAQIVALAESEPEIEVLFNCAGYVHAGSILETTSAEWQRSMAINVDSMFHLCKAVLPGMLGRRRGSIINMSSVASSVKGVANRCAYGTSKAAVIGLTKSIAADYVTRGIRCNAICPGTVKTPSLAARVAALGGDPDAAWKSFVARQPMGRLGEPEEVAALAIYLASDESAFVTGAIHIIDGGWSN